MISTSVSHLSDAVLRRDLHAIVAQDRSTTARMLIHIAEFECRGLYRNEGYATMHLYCVGELGMSEDIAYKRTRAARKARGDSATPKLLMVPYLSSLDGGDLESRYEERDLETFLLKRAQVAIDDAGCDGLIASGDAIRLFRKRYPKDTGVVLVSPGIRPSGASHDEHKRFTTPGEAIKLGADYLVVGRPILKDPSPRTAAHRIIDEIDAALEETRRALDFAR